MSELETIRASFATDGPPCKAPVGCEPLPFQRGGVEYAVGALVAHRACLIGDEPGLGKTIQALLVANGLSVKKVLVLCPASLRINWKREADIWLKPGIAITIIGYDQSVILDKQFETPGPAELLVCDESQYLKGPESKRTVVALGIRADYRLFLSGTPIVNRPMELWPILNSVDPAAWGTMHDFGVAFCNAFPEVRAAFSKARGRFMVQEWNYKGSCNLLELQRRLRSTIMVRRTKSQVLKDLPPKQRQIIVLPQEHKNAGGDLLVQVRKLWKAKTQALTEDAVMGMASAKSSMLDKIAQVRHIEALAKVPSVLAHVKDLLDGVDKIIIFAYHRDIIAKICDGLSSYGVVSLVGGMSDAAKQTTVDSFQTDAAIRVFVGQIQAAGTGITLTAAQTVVFAELDWTPGGMSQAEDRAHRIGQRGSVLVQHVVQDGSLDALISKILIRKQKVLDAALDGTCENFSFDLFQELATVEPYEGDKP